MPTIRKFLFKGINSENEDNENNEDNEETSNILISTVLLISLFKLLVCKKFCNTNIYRRISFVMDSYLKEAMDEGAFCKGMKTFLRHLNLCPINHKH